MKIQSISRHELLARMGDASDAEVHCECGQAGGDQPCQWAGPEDETEVIEWMPYYLRESHRAAGNSGAWPLNGALRLRVHCACADRIREEDVQ